MSLDDSRCRSPSASSRRRDQTTNGTFQDCETRSLDGVEQLYTFGAFLYLGARMPRCFPGVLALAALAITPIGVMQAQSARLTGVVTDSVHRAPLAEATVIATPIAPTRDTVFHATRTDANGRFALAGLQTGRYAVSVEHAFTDSIGLAVPSRETQVTAEGAPPVTLALPSVTTLRGTLCRAAEAD